jgi:hypothetical protein
VFDRQRPCLRNFVGKQSRPRRSARVLSFSLANRSSQANGLYAGAFAPPFGEWPKAKFPVINIYAIRSRNSSEMNSYKLHDLTLFRMNTCRKSGGGGAKSQLVL